MLVGEEVCGGRDGKYYTAFFKIHSLTYTDVCTQMDVRYPATVY